ncbi:MAG TPA: bifunctional riboflavin kinase/FAD synthetase [Alphaproteobacteria bacterium]|jgi:riboflavin kinase/FMN adenylyltransferase|nr:bifunctional riboflavin kinase/FAD synthetase [Alphaproteobacteria bacterium]
MDTHHQIDRLSPSARGAVVAIGNFDGVHLGHQAVIAGARAEADAAKAPLAVMTFEPHPRAFFQPATPPFRLTPAAAKTRELAKLGVDHLYVVAFDRTFAAVSAHDFVSGVLARDLGACAVVVGDDFHFGRGREGNVAFLEREAPAQGIRLIRAAPVALDGVHVSSRRIREHLANGELEAAARLLGRPWEMEGPVVHGDKLGRTIGYPTANVELGDMLRPRIGIYAVEAMIEGETAWRGGVASLGYRPTVGGRDLRFEVHLFDFAGDLYDRALRVRPVAYLRDELVLDGLEALTRKIKEDEHEARAVLARAKVDADASNQTKSTARPGGR